MRGGAWGSDLTLNMWRNWMDFQVGTRREEVIDGSGFWGKVQLREWMDGQTDRSGSSSPKE